MSENKDRGSNFTKEENTKLMRLLQEYTVINCKKTDHSSNKQKDEAWKMLAEKFNAENTKYRSIKQLQQKYNNIKKNARKEMAAEKYGRRQTGGGPAPPKPSETTEWLNSIMGESISGLPSVYDSDAAGISEFPLTNDDTIIDLETDATINKDFLDGCEPDTETQKSPMPHCSSQPSYIIPMEVYKVHKENIPENIDADKAFDASTPKSMLRKPISKELVTPQKRKSMFTPYETRKQIVIHTAKKSEYLSSKHTKTKDLAKYAKEEHDLNLAHMKEAHEKAMRQLDELHGIQKKIQETILEKCKYEVEKLKLEIEKLPK